jgi:hypothetical protein
MSTVIGTLAHECGHWLTARCLGYAAELHYAYTTYPDEKMNSLDRFYIILGGPVQTMLTGTIGLILLRTNRKKFRQTEKLNILQWIYIFLSLFWLRQTMNLMISLGGCLLNGEFSTRPDEIRLAQYLDLPLLSISICTGLVGALVGNWVFFKCIPRGQKLSFLMAGFTGGMAGYVLWVVWLGKYIMS